MNSPIGEWISPCGLRTLSRLSRISIVIELKLHLRGKEQFGRAISGLSKALDFTGTQVGLLIYADGPVGIHDDAISDPRICVLSLEDFLAKLKHQGFADLLRRARNLRVHGVMS